jgi:predicted NBD/HSP70 family sugar kinase
LHRRQLRRFTIESLQVRPVRFFSARDVLDAMRAGDAGDAGGPGSVIAVDIGGDKLTASVFSVCGRDLRRTEDLIARHGNGGAGYLDALREVSEIARRREMPVGISFAGPTEGTRLLAGPNLPVFMREFDAAFGGDFASLFPVVELANDAEAGLMAGAVEALRRYPDAQDVIYLINGSGLGGAVLTGDTLYAAEPGHVPVADALNPFGRRKECGMGGAAYTCVEAVAASRAGIEDTWRQHTGQALTGQEISARYIGGDPLAFGLYDNSAHVLAHAVIGMAEAFGLLSDPGHRRLVVVGHGGIFNVPGYGVHLCQILKDALNSDPQVIFTRDFSGNTCLEGAAVAVAGIRAALPR